METEKFRKFIDCFHIWFSRPFLVTLHPEVCFTAGHISHSISPRMHLERSSTSSSDAPCTIAAGQKDLGTIRMAISSAQGTLRATAQLDLYLYLGRQWHRPFSLICFLFGGFLVFMSLGYFHFDPHCADILCSHTSAISLLLANASPIPELLEVICQLWLNARYLCISPFSMRKKGSVSFRMGGT